MSTGLSVTDVVNVGINLTPVAAAQRNFGSLMIVGSSPVIDVASRSRLYTSMAGVSADFSSSMQEYLAAQLFFSQSPQPSILYIGRWAETATNGLINGAIFSPAQQATLLAALQAITSGSTRMVIDGVTRNAQSLNFSGITNLNGAAAILQTALTGATVAWMPDSNARFVVTSATTGTNSSVSYASTTGTGTDISALLGLTQASGSSAPVAGIAAESPMAAVTTLTSGASSIGTSYGLMIADTSVTTNQHLAVAAYIEALNPSMIYGITTQDPATIDPTQTTDLASQLKGFNYKRTFSQYSTSSPYAVASIFGRAFTVDFTGNNTTITLKFKTEPGVTAESLTETQAATLKAKNCNVFVNYRNGTAIIQEGVMANGYFFDEVHGTDWLQDDVQNAVWNLLYTSPTKVPQTDPGVHLITTVIENSLADAVNNGLVAPGQWNAPGFGQLSMGDFLPKGYYVYAPSVSTQSEAIRSTRVAPTIQCAIKLAGAVHFANVQINVNR